MRRFVLLLLAVAASTLASICSASAASAVQPPARAALIHIYHYDDPDGAVARASARTQRGPPAIAYDYAALRLAADVASYGPPARPQPGLAWSDTTYDHAARPGHVDSGSGTTRTVSGVNAGDARADSGASVAAETGSAATKELTTYYPPNRGFLGNSVKKTLEPGTRIDRYGREGGSFVSPEGTPLEMRALPPGSGTRAYNVYEVLHPFEVDSGTVAPCFGQLGLGTQYEVPGSIADLLEQGLIKGVN